MSVSKAGTISEQLASYDIKNEYVLAKCAFLELKKRNLFSYTT